MRLLATFPALLTAASVLCAPCAAAPARGEAAAVITETVALKHTRPSEMEKALRTIRVSRSMGEGRPNVDERFLPAGIRQMVPDDRAGTLTLRGTAAAVAEVKRAIPLLDVPQRQVLIKARLLRVSAGAGGAAPVEEVLQEPTIKAVNNVAASISISDKDPETGRAGGGVSVSLTPRINGDGSVTLAAELRLPGVSAEQAAKGYVRVADGQTVRITGMTGSADERRPEQAGLVILPRPLPAGFVGYYLEVTPTVVKDGSGARP